MHHFGVRNGFRRSAKSILKSNQTMGAVVRSSALNLVGGIMDQIVTDELPAKRVGAAIELLADAFLEDPIFCFHFPQIM
jgi:hypothetical protein